MLDDGRNALTTYVFLMVPAFLLLSGFAVWSRRREGAVLTAALGDCAQRGFLDPAEIPWLSRIPARAGSPGGTPSGSVGPWRDARWSPTRTRRSSSGSCTAASCAAYHRRTSLGSARSTSTGCARCGPDWSGRGRRRRDAHAAPRLSRAATGRCRHPRALLGTPHPASTPSRSAGSTRMLTVLTRLRDALRGVRLPLEMPAVAEHRGHVAAMVDQLEDYVLPRLVQVDAPLLAVVGGSTGAGESTLVNSLVGERVSQPGVLRPTTRSPGAGAPPRRPAWFDRQRILPELERTARATADPGALQLVASAAVPQGLALLDAPDIDSVVERNRSLAAQLLAAADLWVRHLRRSLRRPGAVGLPAAGRRAQRRGGGRAGPRRRPVRSSRSAATSPGCSPPAGSRTPRCSPFPRRPRRARTPADHRGRGHPRLAPRAGGGRGGPQRGGPTDPRRRRTLHRPAHLRHRRRLPGAGRPPRAAGT